MHGAINSGRVWRKWILATLIGLCGALFSPAVALGDSLQLATIACSDGSQFDVQVDTSTLNFLTNSIASLNNQNLGFSCTLKVNTPLGLGPTALSLGSTVEAAGDPAQSFSVGGGENAEGAHFAFAAHLDPNTGEPRGHAVVRFPDQNQNVVTLQGDVDCFTHPIDGLAMVGFTIQNDDGTLGPDVVFQDRDTGSASASDPNYWQFHDSSNCSNPESEMDSGDVVNGNITTRGPLTPTT
jgi:hypothetical protein